MYECVYVCLFFCMYGCLSSAYMSACLSHTCALHLECVYSVRYIHKYPGDGEDVLEGQNEPHVTVGWLINFITVRN